MKTLSCQGDLKPDMSFFPLKSQPEFVIPHRGLLCAGSKGKVEAVLDLTSLTGLFAVTGHKAQ